MENSRIKVAQALVAIKHILPRNQDLIPGGRVATILGWDAHTHLRWYQRNGYIACPRGKRGWKITQALVEVAFSADWMLDSVPPAYEHMLDITPQ